MPTPVLSDSPHLSLRTLRLIVHRSYTAWRGKEQENMAEQKDDYPPVAAHLAINRRQALPLLGMATALGWSWAEADPADADTRQLQRAGDEWLGAA